MVEKPFDPEDLKDLVGSFPTTPGVYLMKNAKEQIIYVGKAKSLRARVRSYFHQNSEHSVKTRFLVHHIRHIDYILTKTEVEAFLLEASLIKKHQPRYNVRLKDDKAYPYIRCSIEDDFPRFYLVRKVRHDGSVYFGPYTSGLAVRESLRFLNQTFRIRDCSDAFMKLRKRPCMTYQIGRCTAPCVDYISKEDYGEDIKGALKFLRGRDKSVLKDLNQRMKQAAEEERFEAAAKIRDSIEAMKAIWQKQVVVSAKAQGKDLDQDVVAFFGDSRGTLIETLHVRAGRVIGTRPHFMSRLDAASPEEDPRDWLTSFLNQYYADNMIPDQLILPVDLGSDLHKLLVAVFKERSGKEPKVGPASGEEAKSLLDMALANARQHFQDQVSKQEERLKGLQQIQERLGLPRLPRRMECFDISHFQGAENVASQVVFEEGLPKSEDYRLYKLRTVEGSNDFAAMKEVLSRRLKHTEYEEPDLLVIDGGKGQLKMVLEVLKELGRMDIPVVAMAKARTERDFSATEVNSSAERFFLPGRQNPLTFLPQAEALQILVGLRDEAHRFAITYHRKLREAKGLESELDEIVGLGEKRKAALLKHFGSVEALRSASAHEIAELKGFNPVLAERILLHLR